MKETKIKELVEKSKLETSTNFTKNILEKIEANQEVEGKLAWPFRVIFPTVAVLIAVIGFAVFRFTNASPLWFNETSTNLKAPFFLLFSIVFLLCLNYMIRLNEVRIRMKHSL